MKFLSFLAQACAVLAGVILTAVTLITCISLIGRNTTGWTILGDYELTAVAAGAAVALFMPLCQLRREHIIVDFFTAKASASTNAFFDRFGALLLSLMLTVLAWRTAVGGFSAHASMTTTMMLGFPEWITYAFMVPPLLLTGVIALVQAVGPAQAEEGRGMSSLTLALSIFGVMLALMVVRVPIAVAMFAAGTYGYLYQVGLPPFLNNLNGLAFARFASYDLSVIPLFILMGNFATQGGISKALFQFASVLMARFKGGLAMAAVGASAAFGSICGSSIATAATITSVALPEMKRHGYSGRLATGTLAAGGTLGILIPPSVPLVIYAILTEQNIAKLFAAATIPGIIAMLGYMIAIAIYVRVSPGHAPDHDVDLPKMSLQALLGVLPLAVVFLVVFGGIYGGLFTPTEGAGVGVACTFIAALIKGELTLAKVKQCFLSTAAASAMIFMIFIGADMMNTALALTQVPAQLAGVIQGWDVPPVAVVGGILLFYVVLGAVMDELSMILLTIPIFFPVIMGLDFGMPQESVAIWFGIMVLMTVGFGLLAPPVGLNVYVVNGMAKDVPIGESYRGVMPFLAADTLRTLLLLFFPAISLWLVQFVG